MESSLRISNPIALELDTSYGVESPTPSHNYMHEASIDHDKADLYRHGYTPMSPLGGDPLYKSEAFHQTWNAIEHLGELIDKTGPEQHRLLSMAMFLQSTLYDVKDIVDQYKIDGLCSEATDLDGYAIIPSWKDTADASNLAKRVLFEASYTWREFNVTWYLLNACYPCLFLFEDPVVSTEVVRSVKRSRDDSTPSLDSMRTSAPKRSNV